MNAPKPDVVLGPVPNAFGFDGSLGVLPAWEPNAGVPPVPFPSLLLPNANFVDAPPKANGFDAGVVLGLSGFTPNVVDGALNTDVDVEAGAFASDAEDIGAPNGVPDAVSCLATKKLLGVLNGVVEAASDLPPNTGAGVPNGVVEPGASVLALNCEGPPNGVVLAGLGTNALDGTPNGVVDGAPSSLGGCWAAGVPNTPAVSVFAAPKALDDDPKAGFSPKEVVANGVLAGSCEDPTVSLFAVDGLNKKVVVGVDVAGVSVGLANTEVPLFLSPLWKNGFVGALPVVVEVVDSTGLAKKGFVIGVVVTAAGADGVVSDAGLLKLKLNVGFDVALDVASTAPDETCVLLATVVG